MSMNRKSTQIRESARKQATKTSEALQEVIRRRAYQLYVEGGRREGHAIEDWSRAEREVLGRSCRRGVREDPGVH